jgi:DNA-binding MarR family transcriptional regulator
MQMHQLYKLGRTLIDAAQRAQGATETGMSASEFVVLRDLFLNGQSSISEIVARTDIAQSRVSICIRRLAGRGWVLTASDPSDARKTLARVSERVEDEGARRRAMNAQDALAPLLIKCSAKERRAITDTLERLYELAVDAGDETLTPRHMGTVTGSTNRRGTPDALDGSKTERTRRPARSRSKPTQD